MLIVSVCVLFNENYVQFDSCMWCRKKHTLPPLCLHSLDSSCQAHLPALYSYISMEDQRYLNNKLSHRLSIKINLLQCMSTDKSTLQGNEHSCHLLFVLLIGYGKHGKSSSLVSKCSLILHQKPPDMAIGWVEFTCPVPTPGEINMLSTQNKG